MRILEHILIISAFFNLSHSGLICEITHTLPSSCQCNLLYLRNCVNRFPKGALEKIFIISVECLKDALSYIILGLEIYYSNCLFLQAY